VRPSRYEFVGERVFDEIEQASHDVRQDFLALLQGLEPDPRLPAAAHLGVLPLKDLRFPAGYTAPFDAGLLTYRESAKTWDESRIGRVKSG
jgi:hypothetical protein